MKPHKYLLILILSFTTALLNSCGGGVGEIAAGKAVLVLVSPVLNVFQDENNGFANWPITSVDRDLNAGAGELISQNSSDRFDYDGDTEWSFVSGTYNGNEMSFVLENIAQEQTTLSGRLVLVDPVDNKTRVILSSSDAGRPDLTLSREFWPSWYGVFRNVDNPNHFFDFYPDSPANSGDSKSSQGSSGELASITFPQSANIISFETLDGVVSNLRVGEWLDGGEIEFTLIRSTGDVIVNGSLTSVSSIELDINGVIHEFRRDCGNGIEGSCIVNI